MCGQVLGRREVTKTAEFVRGADGGGGAGGDACSRGGHSAMVLEIWFAFSRF